MVAPKRIKFRKQHKGRNKRIQSNLQSQYPARYAIVSLSSTRLKASTIEAVRRVITRKVKRSGKITVLAQTSLSVTAKPLQSRMGKGKGALSYWSCRVKKGDFLYLMDGIEYTKAYDAYTLAISKLPIKACFRVVL